MSITMAFVILAFAIIILFSDDFAKLGKNVLKIKGMKLFVPIFIASLIIIDFQDFFAQMMMYGIAGFNWCISKLAAVLSIGLYARAVAGVFLLMIVSVVLVFLLDVIRIRMAYRSFPYRNYLMIVLWTITAIFYVSLKYNTI